MNRLRGCLMLLGALFVGVIVVAVIGAMSGGGRNTATPAPAPVAQKPTQVPTPPEMPATQAPTAPPATSPLPPRAAPESKPASDSGTAQAGQVRYIAATDGLGIKVRAACDDNVGADGWPEGTAVTVVSARPECPEWLLVKRDQAESWVRVAYLSDTAPVAAAPPKPAASAAKPNAPAAVVAPQAAASTAAPAAKPAAKPETKPTTLAKVGDRVESAGVVLTVVAVQGANSLGQFMQAKPGRTYVVAEVILETTSRDKAPYNPLYFKVKDSEGFEYNASLIAGENGLKSGELTPGDKVRGTVAFDVPTTAKGFVLSYQPIVIFGGYQTIRIALD